MVSKAEHTAHFNACKGQEAGQNQPQVARGFFMNLFSSGAANNPNQEQLLAAAGPESRQLIALSEVKQVSRIGTVPGGFDHGGNFDDNFLNA